MRLGDLDALKKAIKSYADDQYAENEYLGECTIMAIIDAAPTVEPNFYVSDIPDDKVKDLQVLAIDYGEGIAVFRRSQKGKWIPRLHASENDIFVCSICKNELGYDPAYCPNCGADMRGEEK